VGVNKSRVRKAATNLFICICALLVGCRFIDLEEVPIADAGGFQSVFVGSTVVLDGSGSKSKSGNNLVYKWSINSVPGNSTATLSNADSVNPSFTADVDGVFSIQLIVHDGDRVSSKDNVTITATTEVSDSEAWKLQEEFRVGQKLPLRVIYPRPDAETTNFSLHRKASNNWAYKTRIAIQGGEAPFKFELINAPANTELAEEMDRSVDPETGLILHSLPENYATVIWPEPNGNSEFEVKVTDQSGATVTVVWSVQTDESAFVVLDSENGDDTNSGTWDEPLATVPVGLWKNDSADVTYAEKIAVFKDGEYPIYEDALNSNLSINESVKPRSYLAVGENVIFDTRFGHFYVNTGDVAFVGMEFRGSRSDVSNNRIIQVSTKNSNYLFWKLKFSEQTFGTLANDNPSSIFFMDDNTYGHNIAVVDSELLPTAAMQLIDLFSSDGVLIENNRILDVDFERSNGSVFIHAKDDTKNLTIRFNQLTGAAPDGMIRVSNQQNPDMLAYNQEVNYNYVKTSIVGYESGPIIWNQNATSAPNAANTHSYRNTIVSPTFAHSAATWNGGDDVQISGTAWQASDLVYYEGYEEVSPENIQFFEGDLNSNGTIKQLNGNRDLYLGKVGFEMASAPSQPENQIDNIAPDQVSGITTEVQSSSEIKLSWATANDNVAVVGYRIYRDSIFINTTVSTHFLDSGLEASTPYSYHVTAYDMQGNESVGSQIVQASTNSELEPGNNQYVIQGTGFGSKSGDPYFDDLADAPLGQVNGAMGNLHTSWPVGSTITNSDSITGGRAFKHDFSANSFPKVYLPISGTTNKVYFSCYLKISGTVGNGIAVWKTGRIGAGDVYHGNPKAGSSHTSNGGSYLPQTFSGEVVTGDRTITSWHLQNEATEKPNTTFIQDEWMYYEVEFYAGTVDGNNAVFIERLNGTETVLWQNRPFLTEGYESLPTWFLTPINGLDGTPNIEYLMDAVYFDESRARVVMTDAENYSLSTKYAVQPIISMNDSEIVVSKKRQVFAIGDTAYLHVFDEDGVLVYSGSSFQVAVD